MLQREQAAGRVVADADCIEAKLRRTSALEPPLREPLSRHRPDLSLLASADRGEWPEDVPGARRIPHDPRLHLAEDEEALVARDHVELPVARPKIPLDDLESPRLQMPRGEFLALSPELSARIRHSARPPLPSAELVAGEVAVGFESPERGADLGDRAAGTECDLLHGVAALGGLQDRA